MSVGRNTTYNLLGSMIPLAVALVTVPLYIHHIGTERYGVLSIAFLFLGYFGLFDLGLGRATTFRMSSLPESAVEDRATVFWTATMLNLAMGLLGALVLWGFSRYFFAHQFKTTPDLRSEILESLPILALSVPVATITGVLTGTLQARNRFLEANVISTTSTVLFQIFPLLVAWIWGPRLEGLLAAALLARLAAILVLFRSAHRAAASGRPITLNRSEIPMLLGFGGWVFADGMLSPILAMVDRFAIGAFLGGSALTIYTVPYQLAQRITILPNALLSAIFPSLPTASVEDRKSIGIKSTAVLIVMLSTPVLAIIFLMHPLFELWLGRSVGSPAATVGVLILVGFWLNALAWVPFTWLQGSGRPDIVTKLHLLEIPPCLLILYLFITRYGISGVAMYIILRNLLDLILLTFAARLTKTLPYSLALGAILLAGALISRSFPFGGTVWWAGVLVLGGAAIGISWFLLPKDLAVRALSSGRNLPLFGNAIGTLLNRYGI